MSGPWLIAGLGNPGSKYDRTRHNAGFWFLDGLARHTGAELKSDRKLHGRSVRTRIDGIDAVLLEPDTFMNESGRALRAASDFYRIPTDRVLVAHDELDLPPGTVRIKRGGGHGGHNGLRSTFSHLGTPDFWRLRIGIGHPGTAAQVTPWVLSRAQARDEQAIFDGIDRALGVMKDFLSDRAGEAMKILHARPAAEPNGDGPARS